jgi:hypothetical protein
MNANQSQFWQVLTSSNGSRQFKVLAGFAAIKMDKSIED